MPFTKGHKIKGFQGFKHSQNTKDKISKIRKEYLKTHPLPWTGKKRTAEHTKKLSEAQRQRFANPKDHPRWKGGRIVESSGYIMVHVPNHPFAIHTGYVMEHRLFMERHLGRYLAPKEQVHHINGIKDDNRIENLMLFDNAADHSRYHKKLKTQCQPPCHS